MEQNVDKRASDAEWSFDLEEMKNHLGSSDEIQVTVKAHLYVEHVLMELMKCSIPHHGYVHFDRVNFLVKLEICAGLGALNPALINPIRKLNNLRNHLAHNLKYILTEQDKQKLFDSFDRRARELILENGNPGEKSTLADVPFSHIYKVIIVLLDIGRQDYLDWKRKRQAAFNNARELLDSSPSN